MNARLRLGLIPDRDNQEDYQQYRDHRTKPHPSAHPTTHPSVCMIHVELTFSVARCRPRLPGGSARDRCASHASASRNDERSARPVAVRVQCWPDILVPSGMVCSPAPPASAPSGGVGSLVGPGAAGKGSGASGLGCDCPPQALALATMAAATKRDRSFSSLNIQATSRSIGSFSFAEQSARTMPLWPPTRRRALSCE